jgi:hypothetical protein
MSTQRALSGGVVPSMSPAISRNWRRTSCTTFCAARPTAVMVMPATTNGTGRADEDADDDAGIGEVESRNSPGGDTALA